MDEAGVVMDFPAAWEFVRTTKPEDHHPRCSWRTEGGALLCDCSVIWKEYGRREERLARSRCGCSCQCHADEGKPEWPGPCAACCEPGMNCACGRALFTAALKRLPPGPYRVVWPAEQGGLFSIWGRQGTPPDFTDGWAIPLVASGVETAIVALHEILTVITDAKDGSGQDENIELLRRLDEWKQGDNAGPLIRWAAAHLRGELPRG